MTTELKPCPTRYREDAAASGVHDHVSGMRLTLNRRIRLGSIFINFRLVSEKKRLRRSGTETCELVRFIATAYFLLLFYGSNFSLEFTARELTAIVIALVK